MSLNKQVPQWSTPHAEASHQELLDRIQHLESLVSSSSSSVETATATTTTTTTTAKNILKNELDSSTTSETSLEPPRKKKQQEKIKKQRPIDFSKYGKRKIALLFSYEGWDYYGLALQGGGKDKLYPSVEGALLEALEKTRLIPSSDAEVLSQVGFSRCGRTDRGVSATGQVVSLWVRSNIARERLENEYGIVQPQQEQEQQEHDEDDNKSDAMSMDDNGDEVKEQQQQQPRKPKIDSEPPPLLSVKDESVELPYLTMLNNILPAGIRVHAWSPVAANFDARFSCTSRHYKYFFSSQYPSRLDIPLMQEAANKIVGTHDFRNMCKLDPTKQLSHHIRTVTSATISPLEEEGGGDVSPSWYVFDLEGTAFLYHQVRHIVAILFLIGAHAEKIDIIDALFNVGPESTRPDLEVLSSKPIYEMASDLPLLLYSCNFPSQVLDWRTVTNPSQTQIQVQNTSDKQFESIPRYLSTMQQTCTNYMLRSIITKHHLCSALSFYLQKPVQECDISDFGNNNRQDVQLGGGTVLSSTKNYKPLLLRERGDTPEVANERYRLGAGARRQEKRAAKLRQKQQE